MRSCIGSNLEEEVVGERGGEDLATVYIIDGAIVKQCAAPLGHARPRDDPSP